MNEKINYIITVKSLIILILICFVICGCNNESNRKYMNAEVSDNPSNSQNTESCSTISNTQIITEHFETQPLLINENASVCESSNNSHTKSYLYEKENINNNNKVETQPDTKTDIKTQSINYIEQLNFNDKIYDVKMGRERQISLIADKTTLPIELQPYCYPYDIDKIWDDIKEYAKSKGCTVFGTVDNNMTEEIAWNECSWDSPDIWAYPGDQDIINGYNTPGLFQPKSSEVDIVLRFRKKIFSYIDFLSKDGLECLAYWYIPHTEEYVDQYGNPSTWNNQAPVRYKVYRFYGWGDIPQINIE